MHPAIFLDRDGVIVENRVDYIRSWRDVAPIPGSFTALKRASLSPYQIVIVTNQSAVGRGLISLDDAVKINERLVLEIEKVGGRIDGVWMCPHVPDFNCNCRKPRPGMFFQAAKSLSLDLKRSIMVGDAITDLLAAQAAGVPDLFLVRTGRGEEQLTLLAENPSLQFSLYDNLLDALEDLVPDINLA